MTGTIQWSFTHQSTRKLAHHYASQLTGCTTGMSENESITLLLSVNRSRSIAAGLDPFLYDDITRDVAGFDDWRARFSAAAQRFEARGKESSTDAEDATANEAFGLATLCFHFATCVPGADRATIAELLARAARAHRAMLASAGRRYDAFEVERSGGMFCGILERPDVDGRVPLIIVVPGLDSSKEEFDRLAGRIRERRVAKLRVDGPRPGCDSLVQCLDRRLRVRRGCRNRRRRVANRPRSHPARCDLPQPWRLFRPRALAFEHRVRAALAVTGPFAFPAWEDIPLMLRDILSLRCGGANAAQAFAEAVDLAPIFKKIEQPLLVIGGGTDPVVAPDDARKLADLAPNGKLIEVVEGDHPGANRRWQWESRAIDWLVDELR